MANGVKTRWTQDMDAFLFKNFRLLTNVELANALGLTLTVTRNRLYYLDLKRMKMEYWSQEEIDYLKENYKTTGDVEIAEYLETHYPKSKKWTNKHIRKKRVYLGLYRTKEQSQAISKANASLGGNSYTIDKNSAGVNMHDKWIAQRIAWRDPELQKEVLKHPELINLKRSQLKLVRTLNQVKNARK